jgi:hypothetical protein
MGKSDKQVITRSQVVFNQGRTMRSSKTNHVMNKVFAAPANHKMPDLKLHKRHHAHKDLKLAEKTEN